MTYNAHVATSAGAVVTNSNELSVLRQAVVIAVLSIALGTAIVVLARRRVLSLRYTLGWLVLAVLGLFAASLTGLVAPAARYLGLTPTAVFAMASTIVLLAIAVQLSISVSGLQQHVRRLAEAHALLADRVDAAKGG